MSLDIDFDLPCGEDRSDGEPRQARRGDHPQTLSDVRSLDQLGPQPGWYAIDVNFLHGTNRPATWPGWRFQKIAERDLNYEYFWLFKPVDCIAYSYVVYQITRDEANRVRRELGIPPLGVDHTR